MSLKRVIARLDIKGSNLIKSIQLEGLRVIGDPNEFAIKYYEDGADELVFMDAVASLYGRNNLSALIQKASDNIFIPITVGGGIRSVEDAAELLRSGADKVAINTAAVARPSLLLELAKKFGSQAVVLSVDAKFVSEGKWEVYTDMGRERTNMDVLEWIKQAVDLGVGEILLTSVDREGTKKGFDIKLVEKVNSIVKIPVIASGGMGKLSDGVDLIKQTDVSAIAIADLIHYKRASISDVKNELINHGIKTRMN